MVKLEMLVEGLPGYQTDYAPVDYAAIAHAMRIDATRVTAPGEVRAGLTEALNSPGPFLLDVVNDPNALSIPPHVTAAQVRGFALAASKVVLTGVVGRMINLARSNLRNIPRP